MKNAFLLTILLLLLCIQLTFSQSAPQTTPICNGLATYLPKPEVPQSVINANGKNIFGVVNVQILIGEKGNVEKAQAVSGHPLVRPLAEEAAQQAKFPVTTHTGKPIKINCVLVYNFASYAPNKSEEKTQKEIDSTINLGRLNDKALILQMPNYPSADARVSGNVDVRVRVDLQKGEVVSAEAISGHPLLRIEAQKAALKAKFPPTLMEFSNIFGQGFLIYKSEDFNGKTVENKSPKKFLIIEKGIVNSRATSLPKPKFSSGGVNEVGFVEVIVLIDMNGEVILAKSVSGHPLLKPFAESAARETKFNPTLITTSEPIYVKASLLYKFNSDHTVETNLTDKDSILGSPLKLPKPPFQSFNCKVGNKPTVFVQAEIDENGNVTLAKAITGHPVLRAACETAARNSKFSQTKISGVPVKAKAILLYEYILDDEIIVNVEVQSER